MKKILFVFAIIMTMVFSASAQRDDFFRGGSDSYDGGSRDVIATPGLPQGPVGGTDNDQSAPLGSGLLILSALGGAYILRKKTSNL